MIMNLLDVTTPFNYYGPGKKILFKIPLLGTMLRANGVVPIDRKNLKKAIETINNLAQYCKKTG